MLIYMLGIYKTYMETVLLNESKPCSSNITRISSIFQCIPHLRITYIYRYMHLHLYMYMYMCVCMYKIITKSVHQKALYSYSTDVNGVQSFLYWERTNNISRYKITSIKISESKRDDWLYCEYTLDWSTKPRKRFR